MYYLYRIVLPPNTPVTVPVVQALTLDTGEISFIEVEFPLRCEGLAHCKIFHHAVQIIPYNPDGDLYGNDRVFRLDLNYPLIKEPYELVFKGWNDDDTYQHAISVGVMVQPTKAQGIATLLGGGD